MNRTRRYRNSALSYAFLQRHESRTVFIGLADEYEDFRKMYRVNMPHYLPKDFLQAARAIAACRLFIGNQSSCFAIAEGLKVPRVLEVFPQAPNVIPNGPHGFEAISQILFESIVAELTHNN